MYKRKCKQEHYNNHNPSQQKNKNKKQLETTQILINGRINEPSVKWSQDKL